jgi:hypothetical protein
MFNRFLPLVVLSSSLAVGLVSQPAFANNAQSLVGTWVNQDANTRGITKVEVTGTPGNYQIRTFGQCSPTDCDWGNSSLITYGSSVSDTTHNYGTTTYNPGFATTNLTLESSGGTLTVNSFTRFTDNSGRQNYHGKYTFRKQLVIKPPVIKTPIERPIIDLPIKNPGIKLP